jgi:hypothetical protein
MRLLATPARQPPDNETVAAQFPPPWNLISDYPLKTTA